MAENDQPLTTIQDLIQRARESGQAPPRRESAAPQPGQVEEQLATFRDKVDRAEPVEETPDTTQTGETKVKLNEFGEIVND